MQGRLFAQDVNQLTGRGIPVIQEFAKQFGVPDSEVKGLVESGVIGFPQLQKALIALTSQGGLFAGLMEAQSHTLAGLWSTLSDNVTMSLTKVGQAVVTQLDLKGAVANLSEATGSISAGLIPAVEGLLSRVGAAGISGRNMGKFLMQAGEWAASALATVADYAELLVAAYDKIMAPAGYSVAAGVKGVAKLAEAYAWVEGAAHRAEDGYFVHPGVRPRT